MTCKNYKGMNGGIVYEQENCYSESLCYARYRASVLWDSCSDNEKYHEEIRCLYVHSVVIFFSH